MGGHLLSLSLIISISNSVKLFGETSKDVLTLYARVERLEFCVAKNISPCSYEKLREWNGAHDSSEKFRPQINENADSISEAPMLIFREALEIFAVADRKSVV